MSTPPIPDPYGALGVAKDATATQIKSVYRKLVLKTHPDKITDESKKAAAADEFHKVQQAYEILSDEDRRSKYDASVRLAELRKEVLQRQQATGGREQRPSPFASPVSAQSPTFSPVFSPRHERPRSYDQEYFDDPPSSRTASRRPSYVEREPKKQSKSESERKQYAAKTEKSSREHRKKYTESSRKEERKTKSYSKQQVPDDSDESDTELPRSRRRSYEIPQDRERERDRDQYRVRKHESSDSEPDVHSRRMRDVSNDIKDYIKRSNQKSGGDDASRRPPPLRTPVDDVRNDYSSNVRRSSLQSPTLERDPRRDFSRRDSAPATQIKHDVANARPPLEKNHTTPPERLTADKKSKSTSSTKTYTFYDVSEGAPATFRRSDSDPTVRASRRPALPRESSRLKTEFKNDPNTEYNNGLPTPRGSPPKSRHPSFPATVEVYDERDESPRGTRPRRHDSDSPPPSGRPTLDRKGRSYSSRNVPQVPVPPLSMPKKGPQYATYMTDEPRSAHPSPTREGSPQLLFHEMPQSERRSARNSRDERDNTRDRERERDRDRDREREYERDSKTLKDEPDAFVVGVTYDPPVVEMKTGRSGRDRGEGRDRERERDRGEGRERERDKERGEGRQSRRTSEKPGLKRGHTFSPGMSKGIFSF